MGQPVGIDSMLFVYYLHENPTYVDQVEKIFDDIKKGRMQAVFSAIGLIEILTGVKQIGRKDLVNQYQQLIAAFPNLTIANLNQGIIEIASDLRAKYGVRTPDAIHIATAIDFGAGKFITNDKRLKRIKEITVETLR